MKIKLFAILLCLALAGCLNPRVSEHSSIPMEVVEKMRDIDTYETTYYVIETDHMDYWVTIEDKHPVIKKMYQKDIPIWAFVLLAGALGAFIGALLESGRKR